MVPQVAALTAAGIPVMARLGFTAGEHALGGYRVQGRGDAADELLADAVALEDAGAFAVVLEMVPAELAKQVTGELAIPTIGIGAGSDCDAQVLVWQDMAGLRTGPPPLREDLRGPARGAARGGRGVLRGGPPEVFPGPEHSFS